MFLSGDVYIDERFYPVIKEDIIIKDGKKLRGLSRNQYGIGLGFDKADVYAFLEGFGKTSHIKTKNAFLKHIELKSTYT